MKAFILAAGEGRRMRPLTLDTPKPLLNVGGKSLIEHQILRLKEAGIEQIIINLCYLGHLIKRELGDGRKYGVEIFYSEEPEMLETAGAIHYAKDLLGGKPFLMVNSDVWLDIDYRVFSENAKSGFFHLLLVTNPAHNENGDFYLTNSNFVSTEVESNLQISSRFTFAGVSVICPKLFFSYPKLKKKFPLIEVLNWAIAKKLITGQVHSNSWVDVGTPERLEFVRQYYSENI